MTPIKLSTGDYLAVGVPDDADIEQSKSIAAVQIAGLKVCYQFIGLSDELTEEQAAGIVEKEGLYINGIFENTLYCDYQIPHDVCEWYKHAISSFASLLRAHNITSRSIILKKVG